MNARQVAAKKAELAKVTASIRDYKRAVARRDELVRELASEMTRGELAALAQVTPGRISQITEPAEQ